MSRFMVGRCWLGLVLFAIRWGGLLWFGMQVMPADAASGVRLQGELSVDSIFSVPPSEAAVIAVAGQGGWLGDSADPGEQVDVLSRRAQRYLQQGDAAAAKTQFRKALELIPENIALRQQLVDLLLRDQEFEQAETLLHAGLRLAPQNPALRTRYGRLLFERNQLAEALELLLAKPLPALSEQPEYHLLLAALEQESGRFANAATRYRELLQLWPDQAEWWLLLAITYEQLNDARKAGKAYRQALEKTGLSSEHQRFTLERLERLQRLPN